MLNQITRFSDSDAAWESWNLESYSKRSEHLLTALRKIEEAIPSLAAVMKFHMLHADTLLNHTHQLVGPTGETNELYTSGRGVALLVQDSDVANSRMAITAQLTTALLAGNTVILCSDDVELVSLLENAFNAASLPHGILQFESLEAYQPLLEANIRSVGYVGTVDTEIAINRQLVSKDGAIVLLTSETDLSQLTSTQDPALCLRFITERTRTINITAVGGNATLLELGSDAH
ncbi:1-pyrroline-5-carboxylate dehydrogenase [uncultured Vibrio sp.]|uniref:1-pyrroline-5-carboxylate dehydrogenase n=1 Tax=uncultured Vibrio sp. TaxID=114054 RepID=UPI0025F6D836|nr:1-pyrroline-5-carboxylate dehydrogenase [uncultured Vibrio sp.]